MTFRNKSPKLMLQQVAEITLDHLLSENMKAQDVKVLLNGKGFLLLCVIDEKIDKRLRDDVRDKARKEKLNELKSLIIELMATKPLSAEAYSQDKNVAGVKALAAVTYFNTLSQNQKGLKKNQPDVEQLKLNCLEALLEMVDYSEVKLRNEVLTAEAKAVLQAIKSAALLAIASKPLASPEISRVAKTNSLKMRPIE